MTNRLSPTVSIQMEAEVETSNRTVTTDVYLVYTTGDPWAVTLFFPEPDVTWVFARSMLINGRFRPEGDTASGVLVAPRGLTHVQVTLRNPDQQTQIILPRSGVDRFIRYTIIICPQGDERRWVDWDRFITSVLEMRR